MELPHKIELRKERSFSEKMNGMFTYIAQNYKVIFRCLFFIVAPVALLGGICNGIFQSQLTKIIPVNFENKAGNDPMNGFDVFQNLLQNIFSPVYFAAIILMMAAFVLVKCIVFSHMRLYSESPDKMVAFEEVWEDVKLNFPKVFFSIIAVSLLIGVGFIFLVIPGIYFLITFSMFVPSMIIERKGFTESINRCFFLIKDKWWSTFGLLFITSFIVQICSMVFYMPMYIFQILRLTKVVGDESGMWQILTSVISSVGGMIVYSLFSFAVGMQYFNLVERREGKGLRSYIDEIGNSPSPENNPEHFDL